MPQLYLNNFQTVFIASVKSSPISSNPATELDYGVLRVSDGAAGQLTNPAAGDWYILTAYKREGSLESSIEILQVTAVDNSVVGECRLVVLRGQDGTTPQSYEAGDMLEMRITAGGLSDFAQSSDPRFTNPRPPSGAAGGVLSGTYPNPGFTQAMATAADLTSKVDKVAGKGLSTNDYTNADVAKLAGIAEQATKNATDAQLRDRATHTGVQPITSVTGLQAGLDAKVDKVAGKGLSTQDYTTAEKSKLAAVATGATANATDAQLRDRATHTGEQPISSVTGLQAALDSAVGDVEFSDIKNKPPKIEDHGITGGTLYGVVNYQSGTKFGSYTGASPQDLSKHIDLYGGKNGFSVSAGSVNHIADATVEHNFFCGVSHVASILPGGGIRSAKGLVSRGTTGTGGNRNARGFHCSTDTSYYSGAFDDHNCFSIYPYMGAGWGSGEVRIAIASGATTYNSDAVIIGEGGITHKGNVTAFSDRKLKDDIETIDNALAKVNAMRGVYYTLKADPTKRRQVGVIAQEMMEVLPEVVSSVRVDADSEEDTLVVAYANTIAVLIEAVKELSIEVKQLKARAG